MSHLTHRPCAGAPTEGPTVVHFTGPRVSLDEEAIRRARDPLFAIAFEPGHSPLFLDFVNVRHVSSAALGTLVALHRALLAAGRRLTVCNLRPEVRQVFAAARLDSFLDLRPTEPGGSPADEGYTPAPGPGVLVADDELAVRCLLEVVLRREGLQVWTAADGGRAVELYRSHAAAIGVVLLDVLMPGMDGPHALAAIQKLCPAVLCCFLTGGEGPYSEKALLDSGAVRVFRKPFAAADVLDTVRRLLSPGAWSGSERWIELPPQGA
jgi:anti-anti-sigma factor